MQPRTLTCQPAATASLALAPIPGSKLGKNLGREASANEGAHGLAKAVLNRYLVSKVTGSAVGDRKGWP